jgi:hypothetical protein
MAWQKASGYNRRALMEANISRYKRVIERDILIEPTQARLERAKAEGATLGRPATFDDVQKDAVQEQLAAGGVSRIQFETSHGRECRVGGRQVA